MKRTHTVTLLLLLVSGCVETLPEPVETTARCGDGVVQESLGEGCDDGNREDRDTCRNTCQLARCGDGVLRIDREAGAVDNEACDDGNNNDRDACTNSCEQARCGDGITRTDQAADEEDYEACDDGNGNNADECTVQCRAPRCGDGWRQGDELCDDGNDTHDDQCSNDCRVARCGDGILHPWEICDDGDDNDDGLTDACRQNCQPARCGDGVQDSDENCDDGNDVDDDACIECQLARCGDGYLRQGLLDSMPAYEHCDDGNDSDEDGCTTDCRFARCGDGFHRQDIAEGLPGYEACDDGNRDAQDGCSIECQLDDHYDLPGAYVFQGGQRRWQPDGLPQDASVQATRLSTDQAITGRFNFDADVDTFALRAPTPGLYVIQSSELLGADPNCYAFNAAGDLLGYSDDIVWGQNLNCRLEISLADEEEVFIVLHHYLPTGRGTYQLEVQAPCGNGQLDEQEQCDPTSVFSDEFACRRDCRWRQSLGLGVHNSCVMEDGEAYCWGAYYLRGTGRAPADAIRYKASGPDNGLPDRCVPSPNRVPGLDVRLRGITVGADGNCAADEEGDLYCWGGNPNFRGYQDLEQIVGECHPFYGNDCVDQARPLSDEINAVSWSGITLGLGHICAVSTAQEVFCWGLDMRGVGAGGWNQSGQPSVILSPQYMPSLDGSVLVNTSEDTTCALNEAGEVRCWGLNTHGQIGLSPTDPSMSQCPANNGQCEGHIFHPLPHRIQGLEPVLDVVAGFQNTCAITRENELFCWGRSDMGILGVIEDDMPCGQDMNAGRCQPTPQRIQGLGSVHRVAISKNHACAASADGRLRCWGNNQYGSLGIGCELCHLEDIRPTPQLVGRLINVVEVSAGDYHTCARTQGSPQNVYCWGNNVWGQVGHGVATPFETLPRRAYP